MSIELKVFLNEEKEENSLCFHSVVYSSIDYDVFFDLNETYEDLMVEALNGDFELEYLEQDTYDKKHYSINHSDYEENLSKFISFLKDFYNLTISSENFDLYQHIGVRLVGPGYREDTAIPMLEQAQYNARNSLHGIRTALFTPVNNSTYTSDDIYISKASGSLILTLDATKKYNEPIEFMKKVYDDISNKTINPFQFDNQAMRTRYQSIIKHLNDLNNQKRLKEFFIIIDNEEFKIEDRNYLKVQSQNIYHEEMEIIGTYEGYKKSSDSFELSVPNHGKYYCHLNELSKNDYDKYQQVYRILSNINIFATDTKLKIIGNRIKPKTINIIDIQLIN